jgi:hypothetical protein
MKKNGLKSFAIWRCGLKNIKCTGWILGIVMVILMGTSVWAKPHTIKYKNALKHWTRQDEVYSWKNFEARVVWHATYQSEKFREARVIKYAKLYDLDQGQVQNLLDIEKKESDKYDVFFISIYAGSSQWADIGRDISKWRLVLQTAQGKKVTPVAMESIPDDQVLRSLYPYIDRWSKTYEIRFPKVTQPGESFELKMVGVPADSNLVWKQ